MFYNEPYQTTALSYISNKPELKQKLIHCLNNDAIRLVKIDNNLLKEPVTLGLLLTNDSITSDIPPIHHPIFIEDILGKQKIVITDIRQYVRVTDKTNTKANQLDLSSSISIRNQSELQFNLMRNILSALWHELGPDFLKKINDLPMVVFANLIGDSITNKYNLDNNERFTIIILAAYFYYGLFTDDTNLEQMQRTYIIRNIAASLKLSATKVMEVLPEDLAVITNVVELCEQIKTRTNSIQLEAFNYGVFLSITRNLWFGTNNAENITVALEHPPTWIMMIYSSLDSFYYKKTTIAKCVDRFNKHGLGESLVRLINMELKPNEIMRLIFNADS